MTPTHPTQASVGEVRHTPGPWHAAQYPRSHAWHVTRTPGNARGDICNVLAGLGAQLDEQVAANARLIAAAPDMLAALFDCRRALEIANFTQELAVVDAAIARATSLPNEANHE